MISKKFALKVLISIMGILILGFIAICVTTRLLQPRESDSMSADIAKKQIQYVLELNPEKKDVYTNRKDQLFSDTYVTQQDLLHLNSIFETEKSYKNRKNRISKIEWYEYMEQLCKNYGNEQIQIKELSIVCEAKDVLPQDGQTVSGNNVFTKEGYFNTEDIKEPVPIGKRVNALVIRDKIAGIISETEASVKLNNCCLLGKEDNKILFSWNYHEMKIRQNDTLNQTQNITFGQVADIEISGETTRDIKIKEEKISGKVLAIKEHAIEIEGHGLVNRAENMVVYKLVGKTKQVSTDEIMLGYQFCDFVIDGGKIVAGLIMQEQDMDKIRVLLQSADYGGRFHDKINMVCDSDVDLIKINGAKVERTKTVSANNTLEFTTKDLKDTERIRLVPKTLSAKFYGENIHRSCGVPVYTGTMEIAKTEEGLVLINELLLEEYLYGVVPAEMPSSYENEALKAQAICARTYAYNNILNPGLPEYGAHVDDSTAFQVYGNIASVLSTTNAVKETKGQILTYEDLPVSTYYYSTSCGVGADMTVWNETLTVPYLKSKKISAIQTETDFTTEENFREYIMQIHEGDYENKEGWYRWRYEAEKIDISEFEKRLGNSQDVTLGKIKNISVTKRAPGGAAIELTIEGKKDTVVVEGEFNIRKVLCDGVTQVEKHTGEFAEMKSILPSAYFVMELVKEGKYITGYTLYGGGYGHGIGMSQNGAQQMAISGMGATEILYFFYEGCNVKTLNEGNEDL